MEEQAIIKVVGIGDAGNHIVNKMIEQKVKNVSFAQINTDARTLGGSKTRNIIQRNRNKCRPRRKSCN